MFVSFPRVRNAYLHIRPHYSDVMIGAMASQNTGVSISISIICSGAYKEHVKAQRHWPLRGDPQVTVGFLSQRAKMFPFDDVIMEIVQEFSSCTDTLQAWNKTNRNTMAVVLPRDCILRIVSVQIFSTSHKPYILKCELCITLTDFIEVNHLRSRAVNIDD